MPQYVGPEGNENAKLAIIGESPGKNEDAIGRPFVGESGKMLDDDLAKIGLPREAVWLTNIYKYRPPGNVFDRASETNPPLQDCIKELRKEIQNVNPNGLILLGGSVLKALTGKSPITKWRGSIIETTLGCKAVATIHPASILRHQARYYNRFLITRDIKKGWEESKTKHLNLPVRDIEICKSYLQLYRFIERERKHSDLLTLDIEVIRSIPVCVGLCFRPNFAIVVPFWKSVLGYKLSDMGLRDLAACLKLLSKTFGDTSIRITGQNFKFDQEKLEQIGLPVHAVYIDTNLAAHTLTPELPKALEFNTSIYTREPYYKEEGKLFDPRLDNIENFYRYCGKDVCVENEIARKMEEEMKECGLHDFFFKFVMKAYPVYYKINRMGMKLDLEMREEKRERYLKRVLKVEKEIEKAAGKVVNVNSPKQVANLLYEDLKIPKRKGTNEKTLIGLIASQGIRTDAKRKIVTDILLARKLRANLSRYLTSSPDYDLRIRTNTKQSGTETGRTSTSILQPPVRPFKMGMALQTITKHGTVGTDVREIFVVDPGYVFLEVDLAQAEARVVALLSRDYELLERINNPDFDMHKWTASMIFNKPENQISKDERQMGKTVRHAGNYNMGWFTLIETVQKDSMKYGDLQVISKFKAETCLNNFHDSSPKIRHVFHKEIIEALLETRELKSPQGRTRQFFEQMHDQTYKEGYATIPQATISDHVKQTMIDLDALNLDIKFYLEAHDGLLLGVRKDEIDDVARVVVDFMERPINFKECTLSRDYDLVIPAECQVSHTNWRELTPYELAKRVP